MACGRCWERAIRDDERAVVLFGLPYEVEPDPDYVDQVAVDRVCAGERLLLTAAERVAAIAVLAGRRWSVAQVGLHLGMAPDLVLEVWPDERCRPGRDSGVAA